MKGLDMLCLFFVLSFLQLVIGQIWPPENAIDEIRDRMERVTAKNCDIVDLEELRLPAETLSQLPRYYEISDKNYHVSKSRADLHFQHNLALNRGTFLSFSYSIFNESYDLANQPDWLYHYVSTWADITSPSGPVQGSGLFYDQNKTYANWYEELPFNRTLGLFGPRSWRTSTGLESTDYGADGDNYTLSTSKHTPWYELFLPDDTPGLDPVRKWSHLVTLKYANSSDEITQQFFTHALSLDEEFDFLPVVYTVPYFDCGRSNQWVVSAVSPFIDQIPRYLEWAHMRRFVFTGEAAMDVDFGDIDINPCPFGPDHSPPNYFASTALCKETTVCESLPGFGLQRGGYQCTCQPGLVYPPGQDGPFQGSDIESASWADYQAGFDCVQGQYSDTLPRNENKRGQEKLSPRYKYEKHVQADTFNAMQQLKVDATLQRKRQIDDEDCTVFSRDELLLPEELTYTVDENFMTQTRMATRLAHFLSSYLQNASPEASLRDDPSFLPDRSLHVNQIYAEVLAMVMSDVYIRSSGIYFDDGKFNGSDGVDHDYFAPFAFKDNTTSEFSDWSVVDAAEIEPFYANDLWFLYLKEVWEDDLVGLHHSNLKLSVRSNVDGDNVTVHDRSPLESYTARVDEGLWWGPYYKCDGLINDWVVSYASPFFGLSFDNPGVIEFQGAVAIDVLLDDIEPNQCDTNPRNLWSNTAKCNFETSKCEPVRKRQLEMGAYKCVCLENPTLWVEGQALELEFKKMIAGLENRFNLLQQYCG